MAMMKVKRRFKTAFILGAGQGLRLRPLTKHCPKPLLEIGGRPIITYAMDHLLSVGVDRFIVNIHHAPQVYFEKFPDQRWRGAPIIFRYEPLLLDTGGGLKNIEDLLDSDETIFCYNGDVIANLSLIELMKTHEERKPEAVLALRSTGPQLNVSINEKNEICDFRNALKNPGIKACLFTGIYTINTSFLEHLQAGKPESIISAFINRITEKPGAILGVVLDQGDWYDAGSPEYYAQLKNKIPKPEARCNHTRS